MQNLKYISTLIATIYLLGCAPSPVTDDFPEEDPNSDLVYVEKPAECPVSISEYRGFKHADSTISVTYTLRNLTDVRILSVTVRTYVTSHPIFENVWEVAREAKYSDTTLQTAYFTARNEQRLDYTLTGIRSDEGSNFFFEVLDVKFYEDSLVKSSGWYQYETITVGGQQ